MKRVVYSRSAIKDFRAIPINVAFLIRSKIEQYAVDPKPFANMVVKLQSRAGFRLRVGDYRVIFDEDASVVAVRRVGQRGAIYR